MFVSGLIITSYKFTAKQGCSSSCVVNSVHLHNWSGYQTVAREIFFVPDLFFHQFRYNKLVSYWAFVFSYHFTDNLTHRLFRVIERSQLDALYLNFIFDIQFYMFRTDLLSFIRSLAFVFTASGICYTVIVLLTVSEVASRQST